MKIFSALLLLSVLGLTAQAKLNVVATTPDFGSIAREIGGDKIDLTTIGKPTEDPHFVDAKPSYISKLNRADAVIEGGAELEIGWLPALLDQSRNPKLEAGKPGRILCNEGIPLMQVPTTLDRSKGDIHAAGNPHYTTDPANAKIIAERITTSFCELDAKSSDFYKANLKTFQQHLEEQIAGWQKMLAPYKGHRVVAYHDSWPYFARRFEIPMDLFLEPKPGIPPIASHLAEVISIMKKEKIHVIVVQPYQSRRTAETVASHADGVVVDFPSMPNEKQTYTEWMDGLVKSLVKAFGEKK